MRRQRGATLLELVLVMIVLFILAAVVAPRFSDGFPALKVRTAAARMLSWTGKARADAVLGGARHRLVVDPAARRFWIAFEAEPLKDPGRFEILRGAWDVQELPEDVVFDRLEGFQTSKDATGQKHLEFLPDGTCAKASFDVANDRGDRRTLKIEAATGQVRIVDPEEAR